MLELLAAGVIAVAINVYLLLGGADYGGGVWDLFATGPRAGHQRKLIENSIGPIWEANHVWLIVVVVVLFTGFPQAFARIMIYLHIPLVLMLMGIVARGSAFAFRAYETSESRRKAWGRVFAIASLLTPILLGTIVGAVASGRVFFGEVYVHTIRMFFDGWFGLFPLSVGFFALSMVAFLASVYLCVEAAGSDVQEDFRVRALGSGLFLGVMAATVLFVSAMRVPEILNDLTRTPWSWALHAVTAAIAVACLGALWRRRFRAARVLAALQVSAIMWGWALSQYPHLVKPDLTIYEAAAPAITLKLLLGALAVGALILVPSLYYLFRVFNKVGPAGREAGK